MSEKSAINTPADIERQRLNRLLIERALKELYYPRAPQTAFPRGQKVELFKIAARMIGDCPMTYLEFGVHKGWSIRKIAALFGNPDAKFFGFDSFEGLPERWAHMVPGTFSTGGTEPSTKRDDRIRFVKGWFQNTLSDFLSTHHIVGPVLVNFDADLYSSTLFLLTTLWHHIPEYVFLFDEFVPSEIQAMYDFTRAYPVEFEFVAYIPNESGYPFQLLGRLRNKELQPQIGMPPNGTA